MCLGQIRVSFLWENVLASQDLLQAWINYVFLPRAVGKGESVVR